MAQNGYKMGRTNGNNSAAPGKGANSIWTGIFAGMLIGVTLAAGVAWYLVKRPNPYLNKEQPVLAKPQPDTGKPATALDKTPAAGDGKQRFEFYKMLTDKPGVTASPKPAGVAGKAAPTDSKPAAAYEPQILQAGSFSNANDAESLKAKLGLLGIVASVETATIPDKGVWYRVRSGPYKSEADMNQARGFLKQNGVDSTPMRAK